MPRTTYNGLLRKIKTSLSEQPGLSAYQLSRKVNSDVRTISPVLKVLKDWGMVDEKKVKISGREYTNYYFKEKEGEKMVKLNRFLDAVANQSGGYRFGELWRHSDKSLGAIMPILREADDNREYVMVEELKDKDAIHITDSGNISRIKVKSKSKKPVFVRMGTTFEGDTQERAADTSVIIMPDLTKEQEIPVKCVHASKGIRAGAGFRYAGTTPSAVDVFFVRGGGQSEVWNSVSNYSSARIMTLQRAGADVGGVRHDDLVGSMKKVREFKKKTKDILKHIPCLENQVGAVIFDQKGVLSVELFDHAKSWEAFHTSIYEKYEDILTDEQDTALFELKKEVIPKLVDAFFEDMKSAELSELKKDEQGKYTYTTFGLGKTALGEMTVLNDKIIHVLGIRKGYGQSQPERPQEPPIRMPQQVWGDRSNYRIHTLNRTESKKEKKPVIVGFGGGSFRGAGAKF